MSFFLISTAAFIVVLGLLVLIHEFGHFAAAKWVGMRVERFSLFFPPLIWRKQRGETEYAVGSIPLGGYVRISGMNPSEELPEEVRDRAYHSQPVWKRMVVIAAGNPFSITSTVADACVGSRGPISERYANRSTNASSRFIPGPAAITTIRFQTGCEWYARSRTSSGRSSDGFMPLIRT